MSNRLRKVLSHFKMRDVAQEAGISYNILKNFSCGHKQHLTNEEFNAVVEAISRLTNLKEAN